MNNILENMLQKYSCSSLNDYENALKEIVQEIALLGLTRAKFFEHAAFYGGTALRILYGLDRFSEDLDFSLLKPDENFVLEPYLQAIATEINSVGLQVSVSEKIKNLETSISNLIEVNIPKNLISAMHHNQQLKIKLEIDTYPPANFKTEAKHLLQPIPFSILSYQLPDLFAGKIHAVLCRQWKIRIKGRDWYDFVWFIGKQTPIRLAHLEARLTQNKFWDSNNPLTEVDVLEMLVNKINSVDFELAKQDILPFLRDPLAISPWSKEFFLDILNRLKFI